MMKSWIACCLLGLIMNLSPQEEAQFYEQLRNEIRKNYSQMMQIKHNMTTNNERQLFENCKNILDLKIALFKKYYQSPLVQNPKVRQILEELFKKESITLEDLNQLKHF